MTRRATFEFRTVGPLSALPGHLGRALHPGLRALVPPPGALSLLKARVHAGRRSAPRPSSARDPAGTPQGRICAGPGRAPSRRAPSRGACPLSGGRGRQRAALLGQLVPARPPPSGERAPGAATPTFCRGGFWGAQFWKGQLDATLPGESVPVYSPSGEVCPRAPPF